MAKRKSEVFLPSVFKTLSNKRFLNATLDPLIQEPNLKKFYGYIGQQDQSPVFNKNDYYIAEGDNYSQFYQLEPGIVLWKRQLGTNTYKINNVYNYVDLLNQIVADGGINNDHERLFKNRYYSYNGFIDLDKITNHRQYYWVPNGPQTVDVTASGVATEKNYYFHRNSYVANNETELQSAALGISGYTVDGYTTVINPTITLVRGGTYEFNISQGGHKLWIQTEIGTSGVSSVQNNISTRQVLGVTNNGVDTGTITFNVPQSTAQDYLLSYPTLAQSVDMIVYCVTYQQLQGQNYDDFILTNGLDGVRAFDTKYIVLTSTTGWGSVPSSQRTGIWQINVQSNRTMSLSYVTDWTPLYKVFVGQGDVYGHVYAYKSSLNVITKFPTLSAQQSVLFYVDQDNPLIYGEIQLVEPDPQSLLNVDDIIGRPNYTSPNGVQFTSGLKVKFTGYVLPAEYQGNEYIVEGVGSSIKLIKYDTLVTPETINTNLGSSFGNSRGYDETGYDGTTNSPEEKDYITINRASVDGNSWSRNNRWFHRDVLQYAAEKNNGTYAFDATQQAKRPIVEFLPNYKLFNYGTNYRGSVTCIDSKTTDAFAQIEGFNNFAIPKTVYDSANNRYVYNTDGIQLLNGVTVAFINDTNPDVRKTLYRVQNNRTRATSSYNVATNAFVNSGTNKLFVNTFTNLAIGQSVTLLNYIPPHTTIVALDSTNGVVTISNNTIAEIPSGTTITFDNSADQVHLIPIDTFADGDTVVAMEGVVDQGNMYYYANGSWTRAQIRNSRPQFPLFDIIDSNGYSLSDQSLYPSSSFAGSKLFGYAVGTGARDSELGFPLVYKSIGNLGDIVFDNYYQTETFNYNLNQADKVLNVNIGYAAVIKGWNNYTFANGWYRVQDKSKQYITKTFSATGVQKNNFDLGVVYANSYYENNVFVYVNNVLQKGTYTLQTSSITSKIVFTYDLSVGDRVFVKIFGTSAAYKQTYTMPRNLTNNSENTEFTTITLGQIRNHLIEIGNNLQNLQGEPAGSNNFRDLNFNYVGGKLLQHSASLRPAALMYANNDVDPIAAIRFGADSYAVFKNQLLDYINKREFPDPSNYRDNIDDILSEFAQTTNSNSTFYYTDMIAGGKNYVENSYTVQNTTYRTYNLTESYTNATKEYRAVLVYLNGVLLINNVDYTISGATIVINSSVTLSRGDKIVTNEYKSTQGCNVPATPTKLGVYPKFKPEIVYDNTYAVSGEGNGILGIVGHDGSFTVGYGDYRDNILLEFEKRVYNNLTVDYANNTDYDLISVEPGAFRVRDYSFPEWTQLLSSEYLRWSNSNNVDIFTNTTVSNDVFTYNYSSGVDKIFGNSVPGYWRGIYNYFYDTDRPHTNPWEMLGFAEKPTWWDNRYGPAPYSSENSVLWGDLELGFVYNGAPNKSYINSSYTRTGLSKIIPVDSHGNLLPPLQSVVVNYNSNDATLNWRVGDQSPQETAWRRSSSYPFAVQIAWALARPAEYCALKYNTRDLTYNSNLNQIINSKSNSRVFDYSITDANDYIPGINVWIRDYLVSNNLDVNENWINIARNSTFNLVYKMGAYTDKSYLTIVADQVSPQSTNSSVIIPQENYRVKVTKSAPVARAVYSAVIVKKVTGGYQVTGFDKARPYFLTIPSRVSANNYGISVGSETAIIYKDSEDTVASYPYGSIFNNKQQVVDFLVSYGRYLTSQGFSFNNFLADNTTQSDWTLAAKEFLFWNQQNWGNDTVISLTPAGTKLNFSSPYGIVDTISNTNNYTKVVDSDNTTLTGRDYRVYRDDNTFSIELKNAQKGIHLLDIAIVQYEHTIIFDNNTVFNDILYDEQVGSRQFRLRVDGAKTQDWNGSLYAPGFFVNVSEIPQWVSYTDYYTGDIVLLKNQYFAAQKFIPGTQKFAISDWYPINGSLLDKELIPNMASGAAQFANFHNPDAADLNSAADLLGKHETGFTSRQYFTDLGLDITSQYKFYLGMIAQKGTQAVLNAFLRNQQKRIDSDIRISEQWAIKLGNYGGTANTDKLEFSIGNSIAINNQYLFEFTNQSDARSDIYNTVKPSDLVIRPRTYKTNIFAQTEPSKQIIPYAGPVNTADVSATVFDISKIYNISGLNTVMGESSKVWIAADSGNQWGVYRLSQTGRVFVIGVSHTSPTELTFTTNSAHNLVNLDYVMLRNAKINSAQSTSSIADLSGFYRISAVTNTTFTVKINNNVTISSGQLNAQLFKLINVRYSTVNDFAAFVPVRGWQTGEIVYIDNGPDGYAVKQNTNSWVYNDTRSPVFTKPTDNFGSSVKINHNQGFAVVGASSRNTTGQAFVYGKKQDDTWQEIGILTPANSSASFGANVDINGNDIAIIAAPSGNKGIVYTAVVNSQQVSLNQAIHYDNLYVLSAGFSTSNSYILISPTATLSTTANIAQTASYSLANFAVGMKVVGAGIPSGTTIANLTPVAALNDITMSKNATLKFSDAATILTANSSIFTTLYANITSSNANVYIGNTGQSITGIVANTMPVLGNGIPVGTYIKSISNITGYKVLTLSSNVTTPTGNLLTFVGSNLGITQSITSAATTTNNSHFIVNGYQSLYGVANGQPIVGANIANGTVISNLSIGSAYNLIGLTNAATISANQKIGIYPNVTPSSAFGTSISASGDGNWLFIGEPATNSVYVYKYSNVAVAATSTRTGDGSSTSFSYPINATGLNLSARDIKVYVNSVLKVPGLDYIKTPSQESITFDVAPPNNSIINLIYESSFTEVNRIITDDPEVSGFGTSVSTNNDGRIVVIGAPGSTATTDTSYTNAGKTYVFERTAENFVATGTTSTFQLSNALVGLTTITTPNVITHPSVTVDGANVAATFNYTTNQVVLAAIPSSGSIVNVETNQFIPIKIATTDVGQQNSNFGQAVKLSQNGSLAFSSAPGYSQSSSQNGAVYRLVNVPRMYGNIVGNKTNFIVTANSSIRINDYLVTFGQTLRPPYSTIYYNSDVYQAANTINAAKIPYITAGVISNGAIYISSSDLHSTSKIYMRNEYGNPLSTMGIDQWQSVQKMFNPLVQDTARFGEILSISPDANTLVVGSTLSNTRITTTFDSAKTTFDRATVRYVDIVYRSGAAHVYEYQTSATETASDQGSFAYATLLNDKFAGALDRYASGVDISNNFILVGAPYAKILGNNTGAMYVYYNKNAQPIWKNIRSEGEKFDSRIVERVYLYNTKSSRLIADLPVYDLTHGALPNSAESYIDYTINYDPAVYNHVPTTVSFAYDRKNAWGSEKVGTLWWDTNSIKYYDASQGNTLEKFNKWGLAFPASTVTIYEWIESDQLPKDYATSYPLTQPLYTVNDVYSSQIVIDENTGQPVTKYYFWIHNSTNSTNSSRPSALELQSYIANARNSSEPFAAIVGTNAFAVFNAQNIITDDTNLVIEYKDTLKPQLVHSEWTMFDDGTDLGVAIEFINKLNDSLTGQDASGRIIPDPNLPIGQKYGMDTAPRQSLFNNQYFARQLYVEKINNICKTYPMVLTRSEAIAALNNSDPLPSSGTYKTVVANITELGYLDKNTYAAGDSVLVLQDSNTHNNGWSLNRLIVKFPNTRSWETYQVQTYNLNDYWSYSDWYSANYNPLVPITTSVDNESDISQLSLNVNDIIYVRNSTNGGWKIVLVNYANLELLAQQNATIQFKENLYSQVAAGQGFQTSSFQAVGFDTDSNLEFNRIFDVVTNYLLTNEYRTEYKQTLTLMIDTIASQHLQTDWMMKTSFVDLYHRVRGLDQLPVYLPQPENTVTDFFSEVKPFHTKLKQYVAKYDNNNALDYAYTNATDFDLQPYYNTVIKKYRSPQLGNTLDTTILATQALYQPWVINHKYNVRLVDIVDGGSGYDGTTEVLINGDGTGATARAYIVNGAVNTIVVTNNGVNYTYATVQINGVGTGAKAVAIVGNGLTRTLDTYIKFDRISYFNTVIDWAANTAYTINTVIVYEAQPYRVITNHTSGSTFDFTKFVELRVKVWYPQTLYAINDVVVYKNTSYVATETFTSNLNFDTASLVAYNGLWLDNACDRVWSYYAPISGMAGRDLAQVMVGIEYSGNQILGPAFNQTPGYDVNNYDSIAYDLATKDVENVYDVYGSQTEDTIIRSLFTDTGLGLRPQDINVDGGAFTDTYSSHAPEEFVPSIINDTLDIKVKTLPIQNGGPDIKIFTSNYVGSKTFSFDPLVTGVDYPLGGIEKFYVIDRALGPIAETYHYTINYQTKTITTVYEPQVGTFFYVMMFGSNGESPIFDQDYYADGVQTDFNIDDSTLNSVEQAYVKVNGIKVDNWTLVNKLENSRGILAVRFNTAPNANDYVQVHLYGVPLGTRAYSEIYEQTFVITSANYPTGYNFTIDNPEIYAQPISAYAIVRLNGSDLLPPQQTYNIGDGITKNFSLTNSWVENIANITDAEVMVLIDNVLQTNNIDYTIYHDPTNVAMPIVQFTVAPNSGSLIVFSDSSQSDFKIYDGNQLWINPAVNISIPSKLTVFTQGNHDVNQQYTKLFSGDTNNTSVIDNGLDTTGFDTVGFDNELSNFIGTIYYTLPRAVTNINQLYMTLKSPNTTGGLPLLPYRDFRLVTPTIVVLSSELTISSTSVIGVRIFGEPVRETTLEYRIFKDLNDNTRYYAVRSARETFLAANLHITDQWIYVSDITTLQSPEPITNTAGVVVINGERITYGLIDTVNKRLGNVRRSTGGTGAANLYVSGTRVIDSSSTLEIPNSRDTYVVTPNDTYLGGGATNVKFISANAYSGTNVIALNDITNISLNQYVFSNISGIIPSNTTVTNIYKGNSSVKLSANLTANLTTKSTGNLLLSNTVSFVTSILVTANSTIKQGKIFTNFNESLQSSTTQYAQFIRATK